MAGNVTLRDDKGRFIKGTCGGPGIKAVEKDRRYVQLFKEAITEEDIKAIIKKAAEQARNGSWRARQFIWEYGCGKPTQMVQMVGQEAPMMTLIRAWVHDEEREAEIQALQGQVGELQALLAAGVDVES